MEKVCISSVGEALDSQIDPRFGRCKYFLIVDAETKKFEVFPNEGVSVKKGAGISAAQIVVNKGVKIVITGNVGPNAFTVLKQAEIKIYSGALGKTCKQAIEDFKRGKLKEIKVLNQLGV